MKNRLLPIVWAFLVAPAFCQTSFIINPDGTQTTIIQNGSIKTIMHPNGTISTVVETGNIKTITNSGGDVSTVIDNGHIKTITDAKGGISTLIDSGTTKTLINPAGAVSTLIDHGVHKIYINEHGGMETIINHGSMFSGSGAANFAERFFLWEKPPHKKTTPQPESVEASEKGVFSSGDFSAAIFGKHLKPFQITFTRMPDGLLLQSTQGSAWMELKFSTKAYVPQYINAYGMTHDAHAATKDKKLAPYVFSIILTQKGIELAGIEGTAWKELTFDIPHNQAVTINEMGML